MHKLIMDTFYWFLLAIYTTCCGAMIIVNIQPEDCAELFTNIYEKYLQTTVNSYALSALTTYSALKNKYTRAATTVYLCHPYLTYSIDICSYGYKWTIATYWNLRIEPFHPIWITQNHLLMVGIEQPSYTLHNLDSYTFVYDDNATSSMHTFIRKFNETAFALSKIKLNCIHNEKLLYARFHAISVTRVQSSDIVQLATFDDFARPSKVAFLSVTLTLNRKKYNIDVDKSWMYINNELFSKTFLKRYFDYHNVDIQFTNEYVVDIMDSNINMFKLKPGDYIVLNHKDYAIKQYVK
jgi:hypothetical protein